MNLNHNSQFDCRETNVSNNLNLNSVHENNFNFTSNNNCVPPVAENWPIENVINNSSDFSNNDDDNSTTQLFNSSSDNELSDKINLRDKIRSWIIQYKVSHNSANCILKIMKSEGLNIPKDVRTLMKTPKIYEIVPLGSDGSYVHYGLRNMLLPLLTKYINYIDFSNTLKLGINIDGIPITKSSKSQLWPILISVINCSQISNIVLSIGIFRGTKKPVNIKSYFHPFIVDISSLLDTGMKINCIDFKFEIGYIVCDAPAKAFLLNVKGHNAYFGCTS